ncbi:MAG TPA: CHAT domain-containing protein, partial [Enhygromyxa sp.]|nr:CHAT domain-containing protein [Enhygromyxa sp.]
MTRTLLIIAIVWLSSACQREVEPEPGPRELAAGPAPTIDRPAIELAGCRHVEGERCWLRAEADADLRLWIDVHGQAQLRVSIDDRPVTAESTAVDGGQRLRATIPAEARRLRVTGIEPTWSEPFELRFEREAVPAVIFEAQAEGLAGRVQAGIELLDRALPELDDRERLAAMQQRRRLLALVDPEAARRQTEATAELAEQLGRVRDFADCAAGAGLMAMLAGDLVAARAWTRALERAAELPEARVWSRYYGGVLASRTGDLAGSLRDLDEARRFAQRLDMSRELLSINEQLATTLAELGRGDEALQVTRDIQAQIAEPQVGCGDRARALGNVAWINLLLAEAGHEHDPPRPLLEAQLAHVDEHGDCPDPAHAARVNLAIVAIAESEPEQAWALLLAQREAGVPPYLQLWVDELIAQVGVATGRWSLVPPLVQRADPGGAEPGLRWMAIVRHAQTLDALGYGDAALAAYLEAEAVLEQTFDSVGIDVGRELFASGRRASAEGLVELLVRRGEIDQAFCRARIARRRSLQTVDRVARLAALSPEQQARRNDLLYAVLETRDAVAAERRDDWQFSAPEREHRERRRAERIAEANTQLDEALRLIGAVGQTDGASTCARLPALAEGELALMQFPRPDGGAWIFVADDRGVTAHAVPDFDAVGSSAWARALLQPVEPRLRAARQIRVMPTTSGWSVPFHALPLGEGMLLDVAPVVYALDLPARERPRGRARTAVVVADPSNNLPEARREADAVVEQLERGGWQVERLVEAAATRARLSEAFADASLLHYAGHGQHGGVDGWGAMLLLHDGDQLAVSDILVLPQVPDAVVLSGCDTASVDHATLGGGMNLGRAFVLAGAS